LNSRLSRNEISIVKDDEFADLPNLDDL